MKQIIILVLLTFVLAMPLILASCNESNSTDCEVQPLTLSQDSNASLISQDISNVSDSEANLNENESVGAFGMALRKMGIWFTFNQENKAQKELDLARLQLIQAKIAAKNNDSDAMQKALDAHDSLIENVKAIMSNMQSKNESVQGLDRAIQVHEARLLKLNDALANANISDDKRAKIEDRISHIENVTAHLRNVDTRIQNRLENRSEMIQKRINSSEAKGDKFQARMENKSLRENNSGKLREGIQNKTSEILQNSSD